jgi:hypothetical protein
MINKELLKFSVIQQPEVDLYKIIQSNAKFKSLSDVLRTKVGINNFYSFSLAFKSSILMRDVIMNSPYVSGWARSSQVLNKTDSKFDNYQFVYENEEYPSTHIIDTLKMLESEGYSMDNMRCLIPVSMLTDYAINVDLLTLTYLAVTLFNMCDFNPGSDELIAIEAKYFYKNIVALLKDYDIDVRCYLDIFKDNAMYTFNPVNANNYAKYDFSSITMSKVYDLKVTYSVLGQLFRHRTLYKRYNAKSYDDLLAITKGSTYDFADRYETIGIPEKVASKILVATYKATTCYEILQGSIVPISITGTTSAMYKALGQRTCYINDTPHFKDTFEAFEQENPTLKLMPPCKFNGSTCYVGYVNQARLSNTNEELTQIPCPIWCKANMNNEDVDMQKELENSLSSSKTKWYIDNLESWNKVYGK